MIKNILLLLPLVAILNACTIDNGRKIDMFNGHFFILNNKDRVTINSTEVREIYKVLFNNYSHIQIPLRTHIKNENYDVFIGIPFNCSINDLIKATALQQTDTTLVYESGSAFYFKKHIKDSLYIAEYASVFPDNTIYFFSTYTNNTQTADSVCSKQFFLNRIKANK